MGGRVCMKKITADHTKMIITMPSGMPVHSSSSAVEPWIWVACGLRVLAVAQRKKQDQRRNQTW